MNIVRFKHRVTNSIVYEYVSLFVKKNIEKILGTFATTTLLILCLLSVAWWDYYSTIPRGAEYVDSVKTIFYGVFGILGMLGAVGSVIGTIAIWVDGH